MHASMEMTKRPVALVTGASAGLGLAFAHALARRGHDLILVARRAERLAAIATEIGRFGAAGEVVQADLTNDRDLACVAERIRACDTLAVLVNNAGFGLETPYQRSPLAPYDAMARLHVLAPIHLTHAALPGMVARGRGAVINVSSVAAYLRGAGGVMYGATKAFLRDFTVGLAADLDGTGVRVQALCPGFTYTEFHDVMGIDRARIPKYLWLRADDVIQQSLRDLDRGKLISIPSLRYKLVVAALNSAPQWLINYAGRKRARD